MTLRKDIKCEYSQLQSATAVFNTFKADGLPDSHGDSINSPFPESFFIDYDVYRDARLWLPRVDRPLPPEVTGNGTTQSSLSLNTLPKHKSGCPSYLRRKSTIN